jgi:hypothetical protein
MGVASALLRDWRGGNPLDPMGSRWMEIASGISRTGGEARRVGSILSGL